MFEAYTPKTAQRFWCAQCDNHIVDSTDTTSGAFHVVAGHGHNRDSQEYDGEYLSVMFAVCRACGPLAQASAK